MSYNPGVPLILLQEPILNFQDRFKGKRKACKKFKSKVIVIFLKPKDVLLKRSMINKCISVNISGQIGVLRALSFLCKGEIESGKTLLDESLNSIPESRLSDTNKDSIRKIVEQFPSIASSVRGISYFHILDCKKGKSNSEVSKGECMNECLGPNPSGGLQVLLCLILCSIGRGS